MTSERRALLLGGGAVLLWSTVATAFKIALRHQSPTTLLAGASIVSLLVFAATVTVRRGWGELAAAPRRELAIAAALGLLNPLLYYLVLFVAYDRLPAQVAQPLNYTWALTLTWLSVPLLGRPLTRRDAVAGVVCYLGVVLIATGGRIRELQVDDPAGVALALGSTVIWALYWIGNTRGRLDPVAGLLVNFAVGAPLVCGVALATGQPLWAAGAAGRLAAAYVGVVEMGVTFILWLAALRATRRTARVANLIFLSPFLSLLLIGGVLGEAIRPATVAGLVLIVGGLLWQERGRR